MNFEQFRQKYPIPLNAQQEEAVRAAEGPVLLLAVPGSGKTTVLVTRLGYMVLALDIPPESILTMTYTVSATADMRARFASFFGEELSERMEFRTINGVCARIILLYERMSGRPAFELCTDEKLLTALLTDIYHRVTDDFPTESDIKTVRTAISLVKNAMLSDKEVDSQYRRELPYLPELLREYDNALRARRLMDYDDQMVYALRILRKYPELLARMQSRYRYFCVDEAQDTSRIQHTIVDLLASGSRNLFMVGDEDQSIYGFRAACPEALAEFEQNHPGARVLLMEQNFRSTPQIVDCSDKFIRNLKNRRPKVMRASRSGGSSVRSIPVYDRARQYAYLAAVAEKCDRETAVLYRDNDFALPVIDLLERRGISYRCREVDPSFFTNRVVRDVTDIIHFAEEPTSTELFRRIYYKLSAGITRSAAENACADTADQTPILERLLFDSSLSQWSRLQCKTLVTHFSKLLEDSGDRAVFRIEKCMGYGQYLEEHGSDAGRLAILEALGRQEPSSAHLLARLEKLRSLIQSHKAPEDCRFILSTIHSAKGLEFDRVILMDVIDGLLPRLDEDDTIPEDECRLFYVGMTRAENELSVFTFEKPGLFSSFSHSLFSPTKAAAKNTVKKPTLLAPVSPKTAGRAYVAGDTISHRTLGRGEITARQGDVLTVQFEKGGQKRLSLSAALRAGAIKE